ncbi:hypothetical protein KSP39_PZI019845 [Platanthera zijinensis]|uniref:Prolyl endopeptidase-like n=1 Tax=Platanthera zijinensis TaxID=2320716 RepID=A0AAP0B1C7_9ASPA
MATLLARLLLLPLIALHPLARTLRLFAFRCNNFRGSSTPPSASVASTSTARIASTFTTGTACLSSSSHWILDSGATHHITSLLLPRFSDAPHPTSITVDNGAIIPVSGCADLLINPSHSLRSALYDRQTRIIIGRGRLPNGLYLLDISSTALSTISTSAWHCLLGHAPLPILQKALPDVSLPAFKCDSCIIGKQTRSSFPAHCTRSSAPFDLIHSDIWGPYKVTSISGYRYFITFIDDYSRTTWLYLLRDRSELPRVFRAFVLKTRTQFCTTIKTFRSDNAREYTSHEFANLCADFGIVHPTSCPYTPQQNGVAERKNRHLLDVARSLMLHMHVPKEYWNFAVSTACFLINRPSLVLQNATPFSLLFPSAPAFPLTPRVFGCTCFVHTLGPTIDKMDPRAVKHIFVGYSRTQKGYVCYSTATQKVSVSADVTFWEDQPFFPPPLPPTTLPPSILRPVIPVNSPPTLPQPTPTIAPPQPPVIRVYTRRPPPFVAPMQSALTSASPCSATPVPASTAYPMANYVSLHRLSPPLQTLATSLSSVSIPNSVHEALQHPGWRAAMKEEMAALWANQTWTLVPFPPGQKPVGCKWVFVIKHAPDGTIDRLKARLVARGFTQKQGLDYDETFSPVEKLNTVRVLISMAAHRQWPLLQLDIKNAFLNGGLHEMVYMQQPPGFESTEESRVCHLLKSLYGLKQSPRAWFDKFSKALREIGFTRSSADFSLFTYHQATGTVLLLVYVDDIIITRDDSNDIQAVKQHLSSVFQTKDLRHLRYFLGLEVARRSDGLVLSQRKYCLDLLHDVGYSGCKPVNTPMDVNHKLCAQASDSDTLLENPEYYRRLVWKLIYLTVTRPDISFAVGLISRYMHSPRSSHLQAVERILRYLKTAPGQRLVFKTSSSIPTLVAYSDADYAGSLDDRRSTSGFCTYFGGHLITWRSKKQVVVARSSAEAEYRAMASVVSELTWIESLLANLDVRLSSPALLLCDIQAAIHIAKNPVFHERTKHIEVDCHFIREKVHVKKIELKHVPGTEQVADVLTKALPSTLFYQCLSKLGAYDLYAPACGGVLGGFESSDYLIERKWAVSTDGTRVPISILYKKNLVKLDGFDPLLLSGYGSYGVSIGPNFKSSVFSLVDRGFIYAIAHIRGGGEMGRKWYEDGKLLKKRNTFTDFIACAEYLIDNKYGSKEKLCIIGGYRAGGLLIGAVLNMRPDLFKAAVAVAPFVDVVTTMLDPTIPLTTSEWESFELLQADGVPNHHSSFFLRPAAFFLVKEWGDPRKKEYYYYMKSYSSVDNMLRTHLEFAESGVLRTHLEFAKPGVLRTLMVLVKIGMVICLDIFSGGEVG